MLKMAKNNENQWCVVGTHPWRIDSERVSEWRSTFNAAFIEEHAVVGIGEIGLDYIFAKERASQERQMVVLEDQIQVAQEFELPLLLHCVRAHQDLLRCVKDFPFGGILHGFRSSYEIGMEYVKRGFLLSLGAAINHEKANKLKVVVQRIGLEHIVVESDAKSEATSTLDKSYQTLAQIFKLDIEALEGITEKNLEKTFRLR